MAFPFSIDPAAPAGSDSPAGGDDQFRALKQAILDLFGIPASPTSITAAASVISAGGIKSVPIRLTNKTGGALVAGDVVALGTAVDKSVVLSDTVSSKKPFVVALESVADNTEGLFACGGLILLVNTTGTITRGNYLIKSATSKKAEDSATAIGDATNPPSGALGVALAAAVSNQAPAYWFPGGAGGGGSTTGRILLGSPTLPDGTGTGNNPAAPTTLVSTGAQTSNSPKATDAGWRFDDTTDEHVEWSFLMPGDYSSGGTLTLIYRMVSATTNNVVWKAGTYSCIDASTDDRAGVYDTVVTTTSAVPGTLGQTKTASLTLTMTNAAAGRKINIFLGRDADHGSDTATGDAILLPAVGFSYVKA